VIDALPEYSDYGDFSGTGPVAIGVRDAPRFIRYTHNAGEEEATDLDKRVEQALKSFIPLPPEDKAERRRWNKDGCEAVTLISVITKLEGMEHTELMHLQALLIARALRIDFNFMADPDVGTMIKRFDPEVRKVWTPDEAFFQKLKKPDLIEALGEAAVVDIPRSGGKAQLVTLAAAKLPGLGWLPKPMRAPCYAGPGSNAWADAQGTKVADAATAQLQAAGEPQPLPQAAE
jgi:hypothetical protein